MNRKNLILTIFLCFISIFMLGCGQTNNNAFPKGELIEENSPETASVDKTNEEVIGEPFPDNLTEEEVISLVEAINTYELKPTLRVTRGRGYCHLLIHKTGTVLFVKFSSKNYKTKSTVLNILKNWFPSGQKKEK